MLIMRKFHCILKYLSWQNQNFQNMQFFLKLCYFYIFAVFKHFIFWHLPAQFEKVTEAFELKFGLNVCPVEFSTKVMGRFLMHKLPYDFFGNGFFTYLWNLTLFESPQNLHIKRCSHSVKRFWKFNGWIYIIYQNLNLDPGPPIPLKGLFHSILSCNKFLIISK